MKKSQIQSFEGLRGVAAILVVLYHVTNLHFLAIVKAGYLAVDLFFVLSGYVMCVSYGSRLSTASEFRSFMLARFARLAPLLFFSYATYFLFDNIFADGTHFISPSLFDVAATLSMTFGLGLPHIRVFNFASWSISTEFYTYVLFGMLWIHIPTRYRTACATALVVSTAITLFTIDYAINHCSSNGKACLDNVASAGATIRCISGFFLGVSAFYFSKIDLFTELLTRPFVSTAISAISVVIISISTTHGLAAFLCPAIFLLLVIALSTDVGPVAYFLKTKLPQTLGRLSYSLYLMHMPLLLIFGNRLERSSGILFIDWLSAFLICLVLTAEITFRFIETPGKKFILDKFSNSKIISKNQSNDTLKTDHAS